MLRNLLTIGFIAVVGLFAVKLIFGLLGPLVALLMVLLVLALKVGLVALLIYGVIRLASPGTAARLRGKFTR